MKRLASRGTDEFITTFGKEIFSVDKSIRFLMIADEQAKVYAMEMKPHVRRRLSDEQLEQFIHSWIIQILVFDGYEKITGPLEYYLIKFQNIIGSAMPLRRTGSSSQGRGKGRLFLIMSFEIGSDPRSIIEEEILPLIAANRDYFA